MKKLGSTGCDGGCKQDLADLRAQLGSRNELLTRVMQYMQENGINIDEVLPGATAEVSDLAAKIGAAHGTKDGDQVFKEYDETIAQELERNEELQANLAKARERITDLQHQLEIYEADDEELEKTHAVARRTITSPTRPVVDENGTITVGSMMKQELDDLGLNDLLRQLTDSDQERLDALRLVQALLDEIKALKRQLHDLQDEDEAGIVTQKKH